MANLVDMCDVSFTRGNRRIFDNISLTMPWGEVTTIIRPSGIGEATLFRPIGGQIASDHGEILFDGENTPAIPRSRLYTVRKRVNMLLRSRALLTDVNVFDNVACSLWEHTQLPTPSLHSTVMMKLETVGLCEATRLMPLELSDGMARRAVLVRAIALELGLIMFDRPFIGQDPITVDVLAKLISELNSTLGVACVVVFYNVPEVLNIMNHTWILADKKIAAHGSAQVLQMNPGPRACQFPDGIADGPIPLCYPAGDYHADLLSEN